MRAQLSLTFVAVAGLGGVAAAGDEDKPGEDATVEVAHSYRGVAQDYLVLPSGGELTAQMRFITADALLEGERLKFTDLALFGLAGRWSLFSKLELSASVELLPKQPATTDEKPWQSVGATLRSPLGRQVALALSGGGGHLLAHSGMWTRESLSIEWKKPIHDILAFDIEAGVNGLGLAAKDTTSSTAFLTEVSLRTNALFHEPSGHWGGWLGLTYAVPVQASGRDPTTEMPIDPQPRLNFHAGTVVSLVQNWDLFLDFAIVDRGDHANRATELPILDGGFDQQQVVFGVTRHIRTSTHDTTEDDRTIQLGSL